MPPQPKLRPFPWFVGWAAATLVGAFVVFAFPAWLWQGTDGLLALGVALSICWLGALAGRAVQHQIFATVEAPQKTVNAMLGGLGVRMFVTLGLAIGVIVARPFDLMPFAVWLLGGYVLLLCLEVFVAMREFGQNHGPIGTGDGPDAESSGTAEAAQADDATPAPGEQLD